MRRIGTSAAVVVWVALGAGCSGEPSASAPPDAGAASAAPASADARAAQNAAAQAAAMAAAPPGLAEGASILWISLDTTRADRLAVYGGPAATPTLAALAADSVVYERAYTNFPETGLSHWSAFTGVLPEVHGNVPGAGDSAWAGPTAAELAKSDGYATGAFIGGITMTASATGIQRGFDVYDDRFTFDPSDMKRPAADVVASARAWIDARPGKWFAFVHLFDAHFPYTPADPRRYDPDYTGTVDGTDAVLRPYRDGGATLAARDVEHVRALYDAELTELDAALAPLLAAVPDDAIVIVTADHGESFEHGYLFNHRGSLHDGVLHVPWILRAPGLSPTRVAEPVSLVDVLPTLATIAGWGIAAPLDGQPAVPPVSAREEHWARTDPWLAGTVAGEGPGPLLALRTPTWKVIWDGDGTARAWDLVQDHGETTPVAVPAELANAKDRYAAKLSGREPWIRPVERKRVFAPDERARLEALGYLVPADDAGRPGPPTPQGPPPSAPAGPPNPQGPPSTGPVGPPNPSGPPPSGPVGPPNPSGPPPSGPVGPPNPSGPSPSKPVSPTGAR